MQETIDKINTLYEEGCREKDVARKDDQFTSHFENASFKFQEAADLLIQLIESCDDTKINFCIRGKAQYNYYSYEANECLYAFKYKQDLFEDALEFASKAKEHIIASINIIEKATDLNEETRDFLNGKLPNYKLCQLTVELRLIEPEGQQAMRSKDYIVALDKYNELGRLQEKVHDYVINSQLPEVYKRTEKGNYYGSMASVNMSIAGVYIKKKTESDYTIDILKHFLKALDFVQKAQEYNPEQLRYKEGIEKTKKNISKILIEHKSSWFDFLTEFENDQNLIKLMKQNDIELFKKQNAKFELEQSKVKLLLLTFSFYLSGFLALGYFLWQIALSEISWFRFGLIVIALPVFFTIVGAFALKTTNNLKEENFMSLIKLAFQMNLKGLNALNEGLNKK